MKQSTTPQQNQQIPVTLVTKVFSPDDFKHIKQFVEDPDTVQITQVIEAKHFVTIAIYRKQRVAVVS